MQEYTKDVEPLERGKCHHPIDWPVSYVKYYHIFCVLVKKVVQRVLSNKNSSMNSTTLGTFMFQSELCSVGFLIILHTLKCRPVGKGGFEGVRSNPPFGLQIILYTLL